MNLQPHCYHIPAGKPFLQGVAAWVSAQCGDSPEILTKALILLPNRRACRALREAFLTMRGGMPMLLPQMKPVGELEEEMLWPHASARHEDLLPAIAPLRREWMLTRMVLAERHRFGGGQGRSVNIEQALQLARELAHLLDEVTNEGLDFSGLEALLPQDFSEHWQQILGFLRIISRTWPDALSSLGHIDAAAQRVQRLGLLSQWWQQLPPDHLVVAAGITSSMPAVVDLLATVMRLKRGAVVLPALAAGSIPSTEEVLGDTHPQAPLKALLHALGVSPYDVKELPNELTPLAPATRSSVLELMFENPAGMSRWPQARLQLSAQDLGLRCVELETQHDEARYIAAQLRAVLEVPGRTAALVTPDRGLARMVAAQMRRYGISIDDSGGTPLTHMPTSAYLRLVARVAASGAAPADVLALWRHPLCACGQPPAKARILSREIELKLLRGLRLSPGLGALRTAAQQCHRSGRDPLSESALAFVETFCDLAQPLFALHERGEALSLEEALKAHITLAEQLAATDEQGGSERLWLAEEGEQLASSLAEFMAHAAWLPEFDAASYPRLFELLLEGQVFRPAYGSHPRLHIFGPMEARLQHYDTVILGSMAEGVWPKSAEADPWMSRPMRQRFGLPSAESSIGEAAHDVYMLMHAPQVVLTRPAKIEGSPALPSRWWVRLETLLQGVDRACHAAVFDKAHAQALLAALEPTLPVSALKVPAPVPALESRPKQVSVTAIDNWVKDPYAFYARNVLRLYPLDDLDQEPDAADFGQWVHAVLEAFTRDNPQGVPLELRSALLSTAWHTLEAMPERPAVSMLWWPRFEGMADWLVHKELTRRQGGVHMYAEVRGSLRVPGTPLPFTLTGIIDRLEYSADGAVSLIDYKTGTPPTEKALKAGFSNQLQLLSLIALQGAFEGEHKQLPQAREVAELAYWKLAGRAEACEEKIVKTQYIEPARARLEQLIERYQDPETTYAAMPYVDERYNHYAHLTRRQEWEGV